jgi:hypothetical protein
VLYTLEDMPSLIEEVKTIIRDKGQDPEQFEIEVKESGPSLRVAFYTNDGGFMVRLFAPHDLDRLHESLDELGEVNEQQR